MNIHIQMLACPLNQWYMTNFESNCSLPHGYDKESHVVIKKLAMRVLFNTEDPMTAIQSVMIITQNRSSLVDKE